MPGRLGTAGVTLVELMVAVAILAIIVAIGVPSYQSYRLKAGRSVGASCLIEARQRFEAHYAKTSSGPPAATLADVGLGADCGDEPAYRITVDAESACSQHESPGHYALRATPLGPQARDGVLLLCVSPSIANPDQRAERLHLRPDAPTTLLPGWDFQPGQ